MCRPGLTFANGFADGRTCLTKHIFLLHWRGSLALGSSARRPVHWVQRAGFSPKFVASAQKVIFHGGILHDLV